MFIDKAVVRVFCTKKIRLNLREYTGRRNMYSGKGADRVKGSKPSVWIEFTGLARENNAVNIGQGFTEYAPPKYLSDALAAVTTGENPLLNQYTRGFGHPRLVNNLGKLYSKLLNHPVDPMKEVLITVGAYHALFYSIFGLVNPGDEVIIIEPFFDCYEPQVKMAGGVPVFVPLRLSEDIHKSSELLTSGSLKLDLNELEKAASDKTKILILNNPHNPTGKVFTEEELLKLADFAKRHDLLVLADEVYEWMTFGDNKMIRFASLPGMWERTVTIGSAGKTFSMTGWKTGWAIAPENIISNLNAVHQNCVYTCPTPLQDAIAQGFEVEMARMDSPECYFHSLAKDELLPKRDRMVKLLSDVGFKPLIAEGSYFLMAEYSALADKIGKPENPNEPKDYQFVRWLIKEKKLATIPPSCFYCQEHKHLGENWIRVCFFKKDETLESAAKILKSWVKS